MTATDALRPTLDLVGQIYDAALDPRRWTNVVEGVLAYVRARSGMLFTPFDRIDSSGFYFPANIPQDFLQIYASRYQHLDLWAIASRDLGVGRAGDVVAGDDIVPRKKLLASPFYKEFLREQGTGRVCIAWVFGGGEHVGVLNTALTVHRGIRSQPFSPESIARMRLLVPHLSRALGVMYRLRDAELKVAADRAALDRLGAGIILIGGRRQVVFANRAARTLLAERDGLKLVPGRGSDEHLASDSHARTMEIDLILDKALAPAAVEVEHFSAGLRLSRHDRGPAVLNVSSLPEVNGFGGGPDLARVIVFLTDTAQPPRINKALLKQIYSLSTAECRVIERICAGDTAKEVAKELCVSEATVRSQLQSAFRKTNTDRQPDLVKLALSLSSTRR